MKLVTPIRSPTTGVLAVTGESCREYAARVGVQEGEDIYKRRVEQPDGSTSIRLLSPDYNCEVTEAQTYRGSKLLYEVRTLSRLDYTEEALFQIDSSLPSVSRAEIVAAHEKKYGQPMFKDTGMGKRLEELDLRVPAILD